MIFKKFFSGRKKNLNENIETNNLEKNNINKDVIYEFYNDINKNRKKENDLTSDIDVSNKSYEIEEKSNDNNKSNQKDLNLLKNNNNDVEIETKIQKEKISWFSKLKSKLSLSNKFIKNIFNIFEKSEIDYFELEEKLLDFDISYDVIEILIEKIKSKERWGDKFNSDSARIFIKNSMLEIINPYFKKFSIKSDIEKFGMSVLIFCGINGTGKTTTIAKISSLYKNKSKNNDSIELKPLFVACDIFRAAAIEQLEFWAKKLKFDIFFKKNNVKKYSELLNSEYNFLDQEINKLNEDQLFFEENISQSDKIIENQKKIDPASVAFSSIEYAKENNYNLVLIDTSGRLHNNASLMAELEKINRVLKKHNENFANEIILVMDGTMGQNLLSQFEMFNKIVKISGIIVTKLDGIAKGGIIISLIHKFKIPIYFIGIGETENDINYFDPKEFIDSLFD
jgi:fused signal recognition particle receptor